MRTSGGLRELVWPNSKEAEFVHRKTKRKREAELASAHVRSLLRRQADREKALRILEFGSGDGFQIPFLKRLGSVIASDVYFSRAMFQQQREVVFLKSDITRAPFRNSYFDMVYSNHVMEHIPDLTRAFEELKRIGTPDCVYAFAVPTNVWLLLTIPAQYLAKTQRLVRYVFGGYSDQEKSAISDASDLFEQPDEEVKDPRHRLLRFPLPQGHGVHQRFGDCFSCFKIRRWRRLFESSELHVRSVFPLLLYGPSEWPLIPTTEAFNKIGICSSVLFILEKRDSRTDVKKSS
ncbi:MAG: hypothetical protein CME25_03250 [Gemmatimonadetes bacterium]|nr:hypothetical protein [Gemmatimonadota bacterium]